MSIQDFHKLPLKERRTFLKQLGTFLAASHLSIGQRFSVFDLLLGPQAAEAQVSGPINFLEVNFRDQWDFQQLFVPPGIARDFETIRSQVAIFDSPQGVGNNFFITPEAQELRPHLDTIAVMELGECTLPGNVSVHGHEAGNPLRSPGRTQSSGGGRMDMATADRRPGNRAAGNEVLYSSTPTPLILHNYQQRLSNPALRNGVLMRASVRSNVHTFYHFEANLQNAQVDRFFDRNTLEQAFQNTVQPPQNLLSTHGNLLKTLLKRVDDNFFRRVAASPASIANQGAKIDNLQFGALVPPPVSIQLNATERTYWTSGITSQLNCPGDNASACVIDEGRWHPGELFGYAAKLFQSGQVRSIGIDFDVHDVHTNRTPFLMRAMAQQSGRTLARLIASLKASGLYDRTLIAMYTLDGGRGPGLYTTGQDTRNAVILAGGMVRGGYYGDIRVARDGRTTYHRPDENGAPVSTGVTGREQRVPAADVYKTVARAAGIPESLINTFPDARDGRVLNYMLRG